MLLGHLAGLPSPTASEAGGYHRARRGAPANPGRTHTYRDAFWMMLTAVPPSRNSAQDGREASLGPSKVGAIVPIAHCGTQCRAGALWAPKGDGDRCAHKRSRRGAGGRRIARDPRVPSLEVSQVLQRREDRDAAPRREREVLEVAGHEPRAGCVGQCEEGAVAGIGNGVRPETGIRKVKALLNQELEPMGRKPVAPELRPVQDHSVLQGKAGADHDLSLTLQYPVHDEPGRHAPRFDPGRDNDVGVKDNQPHRAFPGWREERA